MTDDAALFAAALAAPAAETPRLVLADWYEDHGEDELAWALRTVPTIIPFLSALTRWDVLPATPTTELKGEEWVNVWVSRYWGELLVRYRECFPIPPGAPTEDDPYDPDSGWTSSSSFGVGDFLHEWQHHRRNQIARLREWAAGVAVGWRKRPVSLPPGDDPRAAEERALVLHELVLNGCPPGAVPGGARAWAELAGAGHPLTRLPGRLLDLEAEFTRLMNAAGGNRDRPRPLPTQAVVEYTAIVFSRHAPPPDSPAFSAVRRWETESLGRLEAREFNLASLHPGAGGEWDGWFHALPFAPLAGAAVGAVAPAAALGRLFAAARSGGVHARGDGNAYPRLRAWESFGWLAGADDGAPIPDIAALAERCRWYAFEGGLDGGTPWTLGLACVRPDGHTVAALAATDTE